MNGIPLPIKVRGNEFFDADGEYLGECIYADLAHAMVRRTNEFDALADREQGLRNTYSDLYEALKEALRDQERLANAYSFNNDHDAEDAVDKRLTKTRAALKKAEERL